AVRGARRDRPRPSELRVAQALGPNAEDDRLRHPLHSGGGLSLDAHRRDESPAGAGDGRDRVHSSAGAPAGYPRNAGIPRHRCPCPGRAARRPQLRGRALSRLWSGNTVPVLVVLGAILVFWYAMAVVMNAPW